MLAYRKAYFLLSVADVKQLPPDQGIEIALAGRSNAGKSSVLNRITQNKNLARVSKTPGRTQMVNLFVIDKMRRLVDLPGYGFAKAPVAAKNSWQKTVNAYVESRQCLKGMILIMDIRHPFKELDQQLLMYCQHRQLPVHIVLNKTDKLTQSAIAKTLNFIQLKLNEFDECKCPVTYQLFSALDGRGMKELYVLLNQWYRYDEQFSVNS